MSNGNTALPVSPIAQMMAELQAGEAAKVRVPELEAQVAQLSAQLMQAQSHNQRLEENILGYKDSMRTQAERIRSLEVERDDYGFRQMETQDRLDTFLRSVRGLYENMGKAVDIVSPPKPAPVPEPVAPASPPQPASSSPAAPSQTVGEATAAPSAGAFGHSEAPAPGSISDPHPPAPETGGPAPSAGVGVSENVSPAPSVQPSPQSEGKPMEGFLGTEPYRPFAPAGDASGQMPVGTKDDASERGQSAENDTKRADVAPLPDWLNR